MQEIPQSKQNAIKILNNQLELITQEKQNAIKILNNQLKLITQESEKNPNQLIELTDAMCKVVSVLKSLCESGITWRV